MKNNQLQAYEEIVFDGHTYAIVLRQDYHAEGIKFFTPNEYSQQLGYMHHPVGKEIEPHIHNRVRREVTYTQEVLIIKKGKLRVDFYSSDKNFLNSTVLEAGDIILLIEGGHGFKVLEEIEMVEVKQGPYIGDSDKTRFKPEQRTDKS